MQEERSIGLGYIRKRQARRWGTAAGLISLVAGITATYLTDGEYGSAENIIATSAFIGAAAGTVAKLLYTRLDEQFERFNRDTSCLTLDERPREPSKDTYVNAKLLDSLATHLKSERPDDGYRPLVDRFIEAIDPRKRDLARKVIGAHLSDIEKASRLHPYLDILDLSPKHRQRWRNYTTSTGRDFEGDRLRA